VQYSTPVSILDDEGITFFLIVTTGYPRDTTSYSRRLGRSSSLLPNPQISQYKLFLPCRDTGSRMLLISTLLCYSRLSWFNYHTWNWLLNWGTFVFLLIPSDSFCAKTYLYPTKSWFPHHSTFRRYTFCTTDRLLRIPSLCASHTCFLLLMHKSIFHAPNFPSWDKIKFPTLESLSIIFRSLQRNLNTRVHHTAILDTWIPYTCLPLFSCRRRFLPHKWYSKFNSSVIPH